MTTAARKRRAEVGGAAPHEARHVAAAVLLAALGMDESDYEVLVQEARELVKRRGFRRLEVGVGWLL